MRVLVTKRARKKPSTGLVTQATSNFSWIVRTLIRFGRFAAFVMAPGSHVIDAEDVVTAEAKTAKYTGVL